MGFLVASCVNDSIIYALNVTPRILHCKIRCKFILPMLCSSGCCCLAAAKDRGCSGRPWLQRETVAAARDRAEDVVHDVAQVHLFKPFLIFENKNI